jgi:hypothetical protein
MHKNVRFAWSLAAVVVLSIAAVPSHAGQHHGGWNTSSNGEMRTCSDLKITSEDETVVRGEEQFTVPKSGTALHVSPGGNGGVVVRGSDRNDYQVTVCKAASGSDEASAKAALGQITARASGNEIVATGPSDRWLVYVLIEAPRDASLNLETHNGPLSVRDIGGSITARAINGPISLKNISGEADASVQNGPVSFSGNGGNTKIRAQNGPLSIELDGERWQGQGLDASTVNGPVSVRLSENYASGVEVESSGRSPVRCSARQCDQQGARTWDDDHKNISIGGTPVVVHVATTNGPVTVRNRGGKEDWE